MFEHKYPYGDIHELNLDYMIEEVKKVDDIAAGVDGRITALETSMETVQGDISDINGLLETQEDEIDGLQESVAPVFSEESTYAVGDKVMYDNKLWVCDIAITEVGEWNPDHWQLVKIVDMIGNLEDDLGTANSNISTLDNAINGEGGILERVISSESNIETLETYSGNLSDSIAAEYSDQMTYNVGDVVMYNKRLRVCAQNIDTPEEWTEEHWGWARVMSAMDDLQGQVDTTNGRVSSLETWTSTETKTVTGNPITINDGSALPVKSLSMTIEPVQDLHGYDKPWAGGAGKNKLPMTVDGIKAVNTSGSWTDNSYVKNGITFAIQTDTDGNVTGIKVTGTASSNTAMDMPNLGFAQSIILNGCPSGGSVSTYYLGLSITNIFDYGNGVSGTSNANSKGFIYIANGYTCPTAGLMFYPMIRLSTETDATFVPYSNICPIEGYTDCEVEVTGKNLMDASNIEIQLLQNTSGNNRMGILLNTEVGFTYTISSNGESSLLFLMSKTGDNLPTAIGSISSDRTITPISDTIYYLIYATNISESDFRDYLINATIQFELGNQATTFEPYQSTIYTIDLDGTRYGGTVNFETGLMTVDRALVDLGNLDYVRQATVTSEKYRFNSALTNAKPVGSNSEKPNALCSEYDIVTPSNTYACIEGVTVTTSGNVNLYVDNYNDATAEDFKTAMDGVQFCYELATPTELTLTPAQLELLKGNNTITANGATITLEYLPNTLLSDADIESRKYTDEKIAMVLPTSPTTDGTYVLTCTVDDGEAALSWEAQI